MRVSKNEATEALRFAVRDWRDLTPGVYRYFYPGATYSNEENGVPYTDMVVLGLAPENQFRYVPIFTHDFGTPAETTGSLADAGVYRLSKKDRLLPNYLGVNFIVPIEKVKGY